MRPSTLWVSALSLLFFASPARAQRIQWKGELQPITAEQVDAFLRVATMEAQARETAWRAKPALMTALRQQRCIQGFEARAEKLVDARPSDEDDEDSISRLNRDITAKCGVAYPDEWRRNSEELMPLTNWQPLDEESIRQLGWDADRAAQVAVEEKGGLTAKRYAMLKERINAWQPDGNSSGYVYDRSEIATLKARAKEISAALSRLFEPPAIQ